MAIDQCKRAIHRYGLYCGVRYLKNQGVAFERAYFAAFDRYPVR